MVDQCVKARVVHQLCLMKPGLGGGFNSFHIFHPGEMIQFDQHISSKSSCFCSQFGGDRMEFIFIQDVFRQSHVSISLFFFVGGNRGKLPWLVKKISDQSNIAPQTETKVTSPRTLHHQQRCGRPVACGLSVGRKGSLSLHCQHHHLQIPPWTCGCQARGAVQISGTF